MMRASEVSPKMFENEFLDFFSRTHWLAVPILYLPLVAYTSFAAYAAGLGVLALLATFGAGFLIWTLTEYWLHRTAFHWTPNTWWGPKFHFLLHGVHHEFHQDPYRLVMPPAVSLSLAVIFYGMFWAVGEALSSVTSPAWHLAAYAGFVLGYVNYDCTHYILHHWHPKSDRMKKLRAHHMSHHHNPKHAEAKYGVSFMVWDSVFGTQG
jgi:sterol desaturase/sphingolipid hydroxylase (fatty acid hydroxylase superfamily)